MPGIETSAPRWQIELRRNRFGTPSSEEMSWLLEWNDETHCPAVVPRLASDRLRAPARKTGGLRQRDCRSRDGCPRPIALNLRARAAGLHAMRLADARALLPDLHAHAAPAADRTLVEALAGWCDRHAVGRS